MSTAAKYLLLRSLGNGFPVLFLGFLTVVEVCCQATAVDSPCDEFYSISYNETNRHENPALVYDCQTASTGSNARGSEYQMHVFEGRPLKVYAPDHVKKQTDYVGEHCVAEIFSIKSRASEADVVLLRSTSLPRTVTGIHRNRRQIWVMQFLESPPNTPALDFFDQKINYTAGYRDDADIVTRYGGYKKVSTEPSNTNKVPQGRNSSALWIVSNCWTSNARKQLAEQLSRFYNVDIFGQCTSGKRTQKFIDELFTSRKYKYYLSFENSNCREYITEKVFENAFKNGLIPIVYGASRKDYEKLLPPGSYIFAQDYSSPQDLANHLIQIDADENIYATFFAWKTTHQPLNQNIFDRLCSMYYNAPAKTYHKLSKWWTGLDSCKTVTPSEIWKKAKEHR